MNGHIILLGDSIFDNAAYVLGGPSVVDQIRRLLPEGWRATLLAEDGATLALSRWQMDEIPSDATHLVLSVGGNNALNIAGQLLSQHVDDVRQSLDVIARAGDVFAEKYESLIRQLRELCLPLSVCTVYDSIPGLGPAERAGLCVFNDAISRVALAERATLIDLRLICNESSDYSIVSAIEPSVSGGGKIAEAILAAVDPNASVVRVVT